MRSSGLPGDARRIFVYGVTGSGKSTMARRLGEITGLPWHAVDDLTWEPGWVSVPPEEQRRRIERICAGPEWILDSAYGQWLDVPMSRAQLIVGLDYPRWFSLQRLIRRTAVRVIRREVICNGNRESIRKALSGDSIIAWHFSSFAKKRDRIRRWAADPAAPAVVRLTSMRRTESWLAALPRPGTGSRRP